MSTLHQPTSPPHLPYISLGGEELKAELGKEVKATDRLEREKKRDQAPLPLVSGLRARVDPNPNPDPDRGPDPDRTPDLNPNPNPNPTQAPDVAADPGKVDEFKDNALAAVVHLPITLSPALSLPLPVLPTPTP